MRRKKSKVRRKMQFYMRLGLAGVLLFQISSCKRPEEAKVKTTFAEGEDVFGEKVPQPVEKLAKEGEEMEAEAIDVKPKATIIPNFPFKRKIKDAKGREIDAEILGKMDGKIALWRLSDKKRFVLLLEKLSDEDQDFFEKVPEGKHLLVVEKGNAKKEGKQVRKERRKAEWLDDFYEAKKQAQEKKLNIYVLFTGSWCPPCVKLKKKVLSTDKFQSFADENLVLLKFEVPSSGAPSSELAREYKIRSVPSIMIMDANGVLLGGASGYGKERPEQYIKMLEGFIEKGRNRIPGIPSD